MTVNAVVKFTPLYLATIITVAIVETARVVILKAADFAPAGIMRGEVTGAMEAFDVVMVT